MNGVLCVKKPKKKRERKKIEGFRDYGENCQLALETFFFFYNKNKKFVNFGRFYNWSIDYFVSGSLIIQLTNCLQ